MIARFGTEGLRGDHQAVEHEVRTLPDERAVLAGERLALGGVRDHGQRTLAQQGGAPLDSDWNERPAVPEQPLALDAGEERRRDVRASSEPDHVVVERLPHARRDAVCGARGLQRDRAGEQAVSHHSCRGGGHRLLRELGQWECRSPGTRSGESTRSVGVRAE
jgi:hypothetical protein